MQPLELIIWNKVPFKLQKEVKRNGSVQELLQKLPCSESVVEGQEQRTAPEPRHKKDHGSSSLENHQLKPVNLLPQGVIQNLN